LEIILNLKQIIMIYIAGLASGIFAAKAIEGILRLLKII